MPRRIEELDALRGLMLVWITLTHLPTVVSRYVNQPVGFVAATEGFIFLSALFTGRIYFRLAEKEGYRTMFRKLWLRAGRLYAYQLALLSFAFLVGAPIASHGNRPAVYNLLDFYFVAGRLHAFLDAAFMLYRPPLLDILPIYIIFLAWTPFALWLAARLGWRPLFAASGLIWLFAQFGFRRFAYNVMMHAFGLRIPLNEMGAFDLWAWQLWWMVGLWLGVRWVKGDLQLDLWAKRVIVPAAIVGASFLVLRYSSWAGIVHVSSMTVLLNKWSFGFGRILDFAALAALAIRARAFLRRLAVRPLVMMGQASLEVFCVQLLCVFFALMLLGRQPVLTGWTAAVTIAASVSALLLTAYLATYRRARSGETRSAGTAGSELVPDKAA